MLRFCALCLKEHARQSMYPPQQLFVVRELQLRRILRLRRKLTIQQLELTALCSKHFMVLYELFSSNNVVLEAEMLLPILDAADLREHEQLKSTVNWTELLRNPTFRAFVSLLDDPKKGGRKRPHPTNSHAPEEVGEMGAVTANTMAAFRNRFANRYAPPS